MELQLLFLQNTYIIKAEDAAEEYVMSEKTSVEVLIGGKVYTLSGYEGEEYLQKVAAYINGKLSEFDSTEGYRRLPGDMKATLLELNIADDYFKAKAQVEKLEQQIETKDKEIYNLKHDLISNQIKTESDEKERQRLEAENKELLLNKAKLEASLEEKLLGKLPEKEKKSKKAEKATTDEQADVTKENEGRG